MARPVDYRKSRGSKGVHTEDEHMPLGKQDQARNSDRQADMPNPDRPAPTGQGKHSRGHEGQKPKARAR